MKIKESPSRIVFRIINVIIMIVLAFACLAPLLHVFFASISDPILLTQFQGGIVLSRSILFRLFLSKQRFQS